MVASLHYLRKKENYLIFTLKNFNFCSVPSEDKPKERGLFSSSILGGFLNQAIKIGEFMMSDYLM